MTTLAANNPLVAVVPNPLTGKGVAIYKWDVDDVGDCGLLDYCRKLSLPSATLYVDNHTVRRGRLPERADAWASREAAIAVLVYLGVSDVW